MGELQQFQIPVLVVWGDRSREVKEGRGGGGGGGERKGDTTFAMWRVRVAGDDKGLKQARQLQHYCQEGAMADLLPVCIQPQSIHQQREYPAHTHRQATMQYHPASYVAASFMNIHELTERLMTLCADLCLTEKAGTMRVCWLAKSSR